MPGLARHAKDRHGDMQDMLEVIQLEAVISRSISREIRQEAAHLPLANPAPLLLEASILESLSLGSDGG